MKSVIGIATAGALALAALVGAASAAQAPRTVEFDVKHLSDWFWSESSAVGDFNRDGKLDISAGALWFEGPTFQRQHQIYTAAAFNPIGRPGFSTSFLQFADDVNKDGWTDVVEVGWPGWETYWYENPKGGEEHWERYRVARRTGNESPWYGELFAGRKALVYLTGPAGETRFGWAEPGADPRQEWRFHPISEPGKRTLVSHGLGVGDLNGDGRNDIVMNDGWFEQPARLTGDPLWKLHPFQFGMIAEHNGAAQMHVYDVNGDGRPDVVAAWAAHTAGVNWWENKGVANGETVFEKHVIAGERAADTPHGVVVEAPHALAMVDMNGDGLMDVVTGRRWLPYVDAPLDPATTPSNLFWFELRRTGTVVEWIPHKIDAASGVGTQVVATDVNGDGKPDVVSSNKRGVHLATQK